MALILILGASRGLGRALAEAYLAQGHQVIATVRKAEDMVELQARGARVLQVDLADPASVSGLAWQLDGASIDIALYVAGVWDGHDAGSRNIRLLPRHRGKAPRSVLPFLRRGS